MTVFYIACVSLVAVTALLAFLQLRANSTSPQLSGVALTNHHITFDISKVASGIYTAKASIQGVELTAPSSYGRIEDAIREETLNIPDGFVLFVKFVYSGMSTGTVTVSEAIERAPELAKRLVDLIAEEHRIVAG